ncbi:MAG: TSUP family transporter, partial [Vibrio sp.]
NFFISPLQSIPLILALDVICSIGLWQQARIQADIPTFKVLTLGSLLGIPLGLSLLFLIPENLLNILICLALLGFSFALLFDFKLKNAQSLPVKLSFGVASGLGTAGSSVGGPMIVSYMLSSDLTPNAQRATMILFFIVSELLALMGFFFSDAIDESFFILLTSLVLPTLISVRFGQQFFNKQPPKSLKHVALPIMMMVSLLGLLKSVSTLI